MPSGASAGPSAVPMVLALVLALAALALTDQIGQGSQVVPSPKKEINHTTFHLPDGFLPYIYIISHTQLKAIMTFDFNNELFDFDNTDSFLNSIAYEPFPGPGPAGAGAGAGPEFGAGDFGQFNEFGGDFGTFANDSGTESNVQTSSVSSNNNSTGVTPLSQNLMSSTSTSPAVDPKAGQYTGQYMANGQYNIGSQFTSTGMGDIRGMDDIPIKQEYGLGDIIPGNTGDIREREDSSDEDKRTEFAGKITKPRRDKTSHNQIERKYRTNINSKIMMLRDAVPALRIASGGSSLKVEDLEGLTPALKLNKASVLTKATEYIHHLEKKNDMLMQQNRHLQRLIQQANAVPPSQAQQVSPQISPQMVPQNMPNMQQNMHNVQHNVQHNVLNLQHRRNQNQNVPETNSYTNSVYNVQQPIQNKPNKYLLGGMAAVVGTSLFGGPDSDFRGLSAVPFMPYSFSHPSPVVLHLWSLVKVGLFVTCLGNLILPGLFDSKPKKTTQSKNFLLSWVLVSLGLAVPETIDPERKELIMAMLLGKDSVNAWSLLADYMYLSSCESTFENCTLNLLVGCMIQKRYPVIGQFLNINMNLKASLVKNLDYTGTSQSVARMNKLVKVDGVSMFQSDFLISRLNNLMSQANINTGITQDTNYLKYIEIYTHHKDDLYDLITSWRVLELINELTLEYLSNLTIDKEDQLSKNNKLFKQVNKLSELTSETGDMEIQKIFKTFKTVLLPNTNAPELMVCTREKVNDTITKFNLLMNGQELTDGEISDSEAETKSDSTQSGVTVAPTNIKTHKKLLNSLNVVDQDQFLILTCGMIVYYYNENHHDEAFKLLHHLKFEKDQVPLSLLSFTALINVIELLVSKPNDNDTINGTQKNLDDYNEQLETIIRVLRLWLNDNTLMNDEMRGCISDMVVAKGMILNGSGDSDED